MKKGCLVVVLLLIVGSAAGGYYWLSQARGSLSWYTEKVDRGPVRLTISASGSLAALTTVEVGTQISGIVASMAVDFNDTVTAGQLIAQIDPSTFEATRQQNLAAVAGAKASVKDTEAKLENLRASLLASKADQLVAKANLQKAEVAMVDAERDFKRMAELHARNLISQSDLDKAESARDSQIAAIEAAKAQVAASAAKEQSVQAQIRSNKAEMAGVLARIDQSEANLHAAEINLERTNIYSPIDGVIISRDVDVGQTVAASLQAPKLFTIAQDLSQMQIDTAVDEADIGQVKEGQPVTFTVDAYKNRTFSGKVHQIRLLPTTTSSVVTYSVMVNVENPDFLLKPGMTANVEILVSEKDDVLRVPAAAFFFKPPQPHLALLDTLDDKPAGDRPPRRTEQAPSAQDEEPALKPGTSRSAEVDGDRAGRGGATNGDRREGRAGRNGGARLEIGTIWLLEPTGPKPIRVRMGASNQDFTEIVTDQIKEGQDVIVGQGTAPQKGGRPGSVRSMQRTMRRM